ncbi:MAG TPA: Rieske (2Fe-2S) protein [Vicinamibacterales bacterium]|nr:Rieske (2Fe-2S) protein [Vicinamibacterales bacterium]
MAQDPRSAIDPQINTPGREGLTGTAPVNLYARPPNREQVTIAPDGKPMEMQPPWRRDFPIDALQDQYVERRDFMKFLVLTSGAFTTGQLWLAVQNWWRRRRGRPETRRIASVAELPPGEAQLFAYPGEHDACIVARLPDGELVAYRQKCTHLSCAVIPRIEDGTLHCPCHEGVFDLRTGRPLAGPPRRPLPRIALDVRGDDVFATDVEWRTS